MVGKSAFVYVAFALAAAAVYAGWMRGYEVGAMSWGFSVRQTTDGGYVATGWTAPSDTAYGDLLLIKTDSLGDTMWTRMYGGGGNDEGKCVQQTMDGGYVIVGYRNGGPDWPAGDLWLVKTDANGDIVWDRVYGGSFYSVGNWVEQTEDGGYIVTGEYNMAYLWLLKTDENGYMVWQDTIDASGYEVGLCVQQTTEGGYVATGCWHADIVLLKTDAEGDTVWMRTYGGEYAEVGYSVYKTSDEGYIIVGFTESFSVGEGDLWLLKTDANGDTLWTRTYGGGGAETGFAVQQTKDGGYVVVGITNSFGAGNYDAWLLKTDANGDTLWTRTFGGKSTDKVFSGQQTTDGGYVMTGWTVLFSDDWTGDVWLVKTDSLGYVGIEEQPSLITQLTDWEVVNPIGREVVLKYYDKPGGFHAKIYDISGKKCDECHVNLPSSCIRWGQNVPRGVYFIREGKSTARVVIAR